MLIPSDFEGRVSCHLAKPCLGVGDDLAAHTGRVEAQEGLLEDLLRFIGIGDDLIGYFEYQASVVLYRFSAYIGWSVQNFLPVWMSECRRYRSHNSLKSLYGRKQKRIRLFGVVDDFYKAPHRSLRIPD